jgi:trehalose/maltose hydrolase-like predicted phosphorylase
MARPLLRVSKAMIVDGRQEATRPPMPFPPELARPFRVIAFDWADTVGANRQEDVGALRAVLERLLHLGVTIVIITSTNFRTIDRHLTAAIQGTHKRRLYILTNRGAEVYGFDEQSQPVVRWQRVATEEENRLLTQVAEAVRDTLMTKTGVEIRIVDNLLNQRKIDLIPMPEGSDPPPSALPELAPVLDLRLGRAGLAGGWREAIELAKQTAREKGLRDARISSDGTHIELSLTDKSDAINWVMSELVRKRSVPNEEVLISGAEFGALRSVEGSDSAMMTPEARGATFISVSSEPEGVAPGVIHLGGGPSRFAELLELQAALHAQLGRQPGLTPPEAELFSRLAIPTTNPDWLLVEDGFTLAREHEVESLMTTANGYVGTRGSLAERCSLSSPATFVAGVFETPAEPGAVPALMKVPDWTNLRVILEGQELSLEDRGTLTHRRVLDLRQGMLWREWRHRDPAGRITHLRFLRLASLADRHVLLQSTLLIAENYSGRVFFESRLPALMLQHDRESRRGTGMPTARAVAFTPGLASPSQGVVVERQAVGDSVTVVYALASRLRGPDGELPGSELNAKAEELSQRWDVEVEIDRAYRLDQLVSLYTSRDTSLPAETAIKHVAELEAGGIQAVIDAHVRTWAERWRSADVQVDGDPEAQWALRFAGYHLMSAANPEDEQVSVGARALTGEAYKGHVFWDTEIFMLPFYIYTHPATARALLMYRYHTLPAAREKARSFGYHGALYAWESADTGRETTPTVGVTPDGTVVPILTGEQEHHISADIAYAVWQYWQASGDETFFLEAGAEILLETARFWASRGRFGPDGSYHIAPVIGPDEYHEGVEDNAYTNVMAQWNLERGVEAVRVLEARWPQHWRELLARLHLSPEEPAHWAAIAEKMYTGFNRQTGLFEQFHGYFGLEEIDLAAYEPRTAPIDVLLGQEQTQRSQIIKQADVVMLLYLLRDRFPPAVQEANFRYYEPRTAHGSSLSPAVHAAVAARLGDVVLAERYFRQAAAVDLANTMGNAAGGVHMATLGGLWQAVIFGFAGMSLQPDGLAFAPWLPSRWCRLKFSVQWRGRDIALALDREPRTMEVRMTGPAPMTIAAAEGPSVTITPGQRWVSHWQNGAWEPWQELSP